MYSEMKLKPCPKPPYKEVLIQKLTDYAFEHDKNISWIDETHTPDKKWIVSVLATFIPEDEIFKKDYLSHNWKANPGC